MRSLKDLMLIDAPIITLVFTILKKTNVIDWSWWWITSPLWIAATITISAVGFVYIYIKKNNLLESHIGEKEKK